MAIKIFSGVVAVILMLVYLGAVMLKLRDSALILVILVGIAPMPVDPWQSLQSKTDQGRSGGAHECVQCRPWS